MTIGNIIVKNIKGNLSKYVMYYLSNVIVVTIFFLFADFAYNPACSGITKNGSLGSFIGEIMYLCEFVIVIFTVIFSGYSISNFLKSREKEFGLLSMFGLTKSQIRRYVIIENMIISSVSIITGLFFGVVFSKLFYMAIDAIIDLDGQINFMVSPKALIITAVSFFVVLNVISFIMSFKIKNSNIAQLLKGSRIPKKSPHFSKFKAVLAIILIVGSYIAAVLSKAAIVLTMIPIFIAVIIGTRLLFTQFSVYFTDKLKNSRHVYYKGINMITLSQIIYKLKDNAKVMFITSILSGVTLATAVSVYSVEQISLDGVRRNEPNDIAVMEQGVNSHNVIADGRIDEVLKKNKFEVTGRDKINLVKVQNSDVKKDPNKKVSYTYRTNTTEFYIMSLSDYNNVAEKNDMKKLKLNDGEAALYTYNFAYNLVNFGYGTKFNGLKSVNLSNGERKSSWNIVYSKEAGVINDTKDYINTIVVNDGEFKKMYDESNDESRYVYYGYNIKNNTKAVNAVQEIKDSVSKENAAYFTERVIGMASVMKILTVILFIGTFIAAIFFIATGSILYFKMFNEIQKDKYDFMGLKKIGVTKQELNRTISVQSFIMFFMPLIVATIHALFAVKSVGILHLKYFMFIAGIYVVLQAVYYLFAKWIYVKQINSWIE